MIRIVLAIFLCLFSDLGLGQYMTLTGRQFKDENGNNFYPLVCNYVISVNNSSHLNYTTSWVSPYLHYRETPPYCPCNDQTECNQLLQSDFTQMLDLGFNTVRIMSLHPYYFKKGYETKEQPSDPGYWKCNQAGFYILSSIPGQWADYILMDGPGKQKLFDQTIEMLVNVSNVRGHNNEKMKVILITVAEYGDFDYHFPFAYNDYLDDLTKYLSDPSNYSNYPSGTFEAVQNAILAYDLQNEPFCLGGIWPWLTEGGIPEAHTKLAFCQYYEMYYNTIKANEPYRLVTLGDGALEVLRFDPATLHLDFYSPHFYPPLFDYEDKPVINDLLDKQKVWYYWVKNNIQMPWIVGETGFTANDDVQNPVFPTIQGTESEQKSFAEASIDRTFNCSGSGYSWWQFQDNTDGEYWGVLKVGECSPVPCNNLYKPVHEVFESFQPPQNQCNCPEPDWYYDQDHLSDYAYRTPYPSGEPPHLLSGIVYDQNGNAIKDALIEGWVPIRFDPKNQSKPLYTVSYTYSKNNGLYELIPHDYEDKWPNKNAFDWIFVSAPGCSRQYFNYGGTTCTYQDVTLIKPEEFLYDAHFTNLHLIAGQSKVLKAWNSIDLSNDIRIDNGAGLVDISARQTITLKPEVFSETGSETWIHTQNTFMNCADLDFPQLKNSDSEDEQLIQSQSMNHHIQLNFMPDTGKINFQVYPNPGSGIFTVIASEVPPTFVSLIVSDLFGRRVYSSHLEKDRKEINLSGFEAGVYLLSIRYSEYYQTVKIVIIN